VFIPVNAERSGSTKTFKNAQLWGYAAIVPMFTVPIANRCGQVINCGKHVRESAKCFSNLGTFMSGSQYHSSILKQNRPGSRPIYLADELYDVIRDPDTEKCLDYLNRYLRYQTLKFNLWTKTLKCFESDKDKALRFLGALFQWRAYSFAGMPDNLQRKKDQFLEGAVKKISSGQIEGYPPGVNSKKTGLYHFYSMGMMSQIMRKKGVSLRMSLTLPYIFNEAYEDAMVARGKIKRGLSYSSPNIEDKYTGYAGPQFALSEDKEKFSGPKYEEFKEKYERTGRRSVGSFFKKKFGKSYFCTDVIPGDEYFKKYPLPEGSSPYVRPQTTIDSLKVSQ